MDQASGFLTFLWSAQARSANVIALPDGPYGNFAGRDASRGMAKQSFDEDMLTPLDQPLDKLDGLTDDEM